MTLGSWVGSGTKPPDPPGPAGLRCWGDTIGQIAQQLGLGQQPARWSQLLPGLVDQLTPRAGKSRPRPGQHRRFDGHMLGSSVAAAALTVRYARGGMGT